MAFIKHTYLVLMVLTTCFTTNMQAVQQESAYLKTDRSIYVSGETVFFKLHILDASTGKFSNLSKVGYIELRAPKAAPALKLRVSVSEGIATGSFVLPDTLRSSVYQFVAFTAFMKNVGESSFFHREIMIANRLDNELNIKSVASAANDLKRQTDSLLWIQTDKTAYASGEKITLRLGSVFSKASLCVSVFEEPRPGFWEKAIGDDFRQASAPIAAQSLRIMPEKKAKILRGRVLDATTNQTIQDAIVLLSCPDSVANLQYAISDSSGLFQLQLTPYYDGKELFLSIKEMPNDLHWKLEVQDPYELNTVWEPELVATKNSYKEYLTKSQDIAYIQKTYAGKAGKMDRKQSISFIPLLYRRPVKPVYPADFVPLDSFPEIAVELLPTIKLTKKDGNYHATALSRQQFYYGHNDASIFLDGVYLDDIQKIIALNSERIRKMEVLENKRAFGNIVFNGILSIQTFGNEILRTEPATHSLRLYNDSLTVGKSFVVQTTPTAQNAKMPFFKQLLYWNPSASLQTDHSFYASENTGNFLIKVEGIAQDGTPLSATARIQVTNSQSASNP